MSQTTGFSGEQNRGFQIGHNSGPIHVGSASDARASPDPKPIWMIPPRRNPDFVNHGDVLHLIERALAQPSARFALTGLGGIGKSQFAIEFAYLCRKIYSDNRLVEFIFWVDASSQSQFEKSFQDIAVRLGLVQRAEKHRDILEIVRDWLTDERHGDWILIVDNADDDSVLFAPGTDVKGTGETNGHLADFLPHSPNGKVLITSRSKTLARRLVGYRPADVLEVPPMPHPQALDLMRKGLPVDQSDEESAIELLKALGFIPVAIVQASAYITQRSFASVSSYLEDFRRGGSSTHNLLGHQAAGTGTMSIISTLQPSWNLAGKLRPTTVRLLSLMSFFNCQGIQTSLLRRYRYQYAYDCKRRHYGRLRYTAMGWSPSPYGSRRPLYRVDQLLKKLSIHQTHTRDSLRSTKNPQSPGDYESLHVRCKHSTANNEKEFEEDVHVLQDLSLVSSNTGGSTLHMHSVVQGAVRAWLDDSEKNKWKNLSLQVLAEEFPLYTELEPWYFCEQLVTHVEIDAKSPPYGDAFKDWAQIIVALGSHASDRGDRRLVQKTSEMALQFVNTHGREAFHKEVSFPVTTVLASLLSECGDRAAAERLLKSLEDDRKSLHAHHPDMYIDLRTRTTVCHRLGRRKEAEELARKAYDIWTSIDGENGIRTMDARRSLGVIIFDQGRFEEARSILSSLKGPYEELFGEKDPRTLSVIYVLARAIKNVAGLEAAESLYQRILENYTEGHGEYLYHHHVHANRMAIIHMDQGRYDEAEILLRRALKCCEDTLGKCDSAQVEQYRENLEYILRLKEERKDTAELPCT